MAAEDPPADYAGTPSFHVLTAGTTLYRVHGADRRATEFNTTVPGSPFRGGRFDRIDEPEYGYLYAGTTESTALAERLLRDVPFDAKKHRFLPRKQVAGRVLSEIVTTVDLTLLSLISTTDLAAVGQDYWLTQTADYAGTRHWGRWLRDQVREAAGFIWLARYDLPNHSLVLFDDRFDAANALVCSADESFALDTPAGIEKLNMILEPYCAGIEPP